LPCTVCQGDFETEDQVVEVSPRHLGFALAVDVPWQHEEKVHNVIFYYDVCEDEADDEDDDEAEDEAKAEDDEGYKTEDEDTEDVHCFGCGHAVESFSAMLVHLESGNCGCRTTRDDLSRLALACHTSHRFVVRGRDEFLRLGQGYRGAPQSYFNQRTQYWECPWCNFSGTPSGA